MVTPAGLKKTVRIYNDEQLGRILTHYGAVGLCLPQQWASELVVAYDELQSGKGYLMEV